MGKIKGKNKTSNATEKKKSGIKKYIRDFLVFVDKNLIKKIGILSLIALVLIAISIGFVVKVTMASECQGVCTDGMNLLEIYWSYIILLVMTIVAGLVPYIYLAVGVFFACVLQELSNFAYLIKGYGYTLGIGIGIIPLILNILIVVIVAALGIYICKNITISYRITNLKNMNIINFRIKAYEIFGKQEKADKLTEIRDAKLDKLQSKKEKINLIQILNVFIVVSILQFISVLILQLAA